VHIIPTFLGKGTSQGLCPWYPQDSLHCAHGTHTHAAIYAPARQGEARWLESGTDRTLDEAVFRWSAAQERPRRPQGPGQGFAGDVQRTLDDLNVSGAARDKADRAVRDHQDMTRRFDELLRAGAGHAVEDALSEEDFRVLRPHWIALARAASRGRAPPDLNVRIEQLQKELDDLRKKLPK
jgi:hypothetical protein